MKSKKTLMIKLTIMSKDFIHIITILSKNLRQQISQRYQKSNVIQHNICEIKNIMKIKMNSHKKIHIYSRMNLK
jgi:hypothetical protein